MAIRNPAELAAEVEKGKRLLGFDVGEKTVGLALSDTTLTVATPLETLKRGRFRDVAEVLGAIVARQGVGGFVVGLPVNMDGSEGPRAQATRAFARNLLMAVDLPLCFWDERLSTAAVERSMLEADLSRARRAELVDKAAAAYILQGFLEHLRTLRAQRHAR
jgi:putative Holliday junction resolvase